MIDEIERIFINEYRKQYGNKVCIEGIEHCSNFCLLYCAEHTPNLKISTYKSIIDNIRREYIQKICSRT